jgi:hypothetical protein
VRRKSKGKPQGEIESLCSVAELVKLEGSRDDGLESKESQPRSGITLAAGWGESETSTRNNAGQHPRSHVETSLIFTPNISAEEFARTPITAISSQLGHLTIPLPSSHFRHGLCVDDSLNSTNLISLGIIPRNNPRIAQLGIKLPSREMACSVTDSIVVGKS